MPSELTLTYPAVEPVVSYVEPPTLDLANRMVPAKGTTCRPVQQQEEAYRHK